MIYQGYTTAEIEELSAYLDRHSIPYAISPDGQAIEAIHTEIKRKRPISIDQVSSTKGSFWQIEITDEVLRVVSKDHYQTLENFRIFPSMIDFVPDFSDPVTSIKVQERKLIGMNGFLALMLITSVVAYIWVTWLN